jgi:hypothetical protein
MASGASTTSAGSPGAEGGPALAQTNLDPAPQHLPLPLNLAIANDCHGEGSPDHEVLPPSAIKKAPPCQRGFGDLDDPGNGAIV